MILSVNVVHQFGVSSLWPCITDKPKSVTGYEVFYIPSSKFLVDDNSQKLAERHTYIQLQFMSSRVSFLRYANKREARP